MAFKKDEVHVKQFSWKLRIVVVALCLLAILTLVYLIVYSFTGLGNPFLGLALMFVLLVVAGLIVFVIDVAFSREWE